MQFPRWMHKLADHYHLQIHRSIKSYIYLVSSYLVSSTWFISVSTLVLAELPAQAASAERLCQPQTQLTAQQSSSLPIAQVSSLSQFVQTLSPLLTAEFSPPYPQINGLARLAKVPVMMYHDILPEKQVFFDVTPAEFEAALKQIQAKGLTPISLDQLTEHLTTGTPLPPKPILLSFDDGYLGHYQYVYPLLKKFGYPGVFGIYPAKVGKRIGRSSLTWSQLKEMAADPLVTIASHSLTHPADLRTLQNDRLRLEIVESKRQLEAALGISIEYFVYPEGKFDERVQAWVQQTGYKAALTMNDAVNRFAGESTNLLSIERIGQSQLDTVLDQAYGGAPLPAFDQSTNFGTSVRMDRRTVNQVPLILVSGGKPITIHANSRYQVPEIIANTQAIAAVDGGFFSLEKLESNVMIGPVLSQSTKQFVPANAQDAKRIAGRPLVLINGDRIRFIPFDPDRHNKLAGIRQEMPDVTDAFVAAAWLVKQGQPQQAKSFGTLFDFNERRDRAFWGIDYAGQPVIGVSADYVDSVTLGEALSKAGLREVVMLDSGASASLAYRGKSMMSYEPRPVPHVVALLPPQNRPQTANCTVVSQDVVSQED